MFQIQVLHDSWNVLDAPIRQYGGLDNGPKGFFHCVLSYLVYFHKCCRNNIQN